MQHITLYLNTGLGGQTLALTHVLFTEELGINLEDTQLI